MTSYTIPGVPDASEAMLRALPTPQHFTRAPAEALVAMEEGALALCTHVERFAYDRVGKGREASPHLLASQVRGLIAAYHQSLDATPEPSSDGAALIRPALIDEGRKAGCILADDVSDEFLALIPAEIAALAGREAGPSDGAAGLVEALEKSAREAVALLDELNERASSRLFYGIGQVLHAKLATIRATIALAGLRHRAKPSVGVAIPNGWQLVPRCATATMLNAGDSRCYAAEMWPAMLAAAPLPPTPAPDTSGWVADHPEPTSL